MRNIVVKHVLRQPVVVFSLLVTFLWVLTDASNRLVHQSKQSTQSSNAQASVVVPAMQLSSAEHQFISQQFERFKRDEDAEPEAQTQLTAEQQLAQQGLMQQVFVNNKKLILKAVITEQVNASKKQEAKAYALINVTDQKTGESKLIKAANNQQIESFTLTISTSTQVELVRNNPQGEQRINLTMYRVADKI